MGFYNRIRISGDHQDTHQGFRIKDGDAVGETPEEKAFIEDTLNVPYVVGGITVITVLSTMLAGFVINML